MKNQKTLEKVLLQEIQLLPSLAQIEILHYVQYIKSKYANKEQQLLNNTIPTFGCGSVTVQIAHDFDAPLTDFSPN
jgi:hypothetical protein